MSTTIDRESDVPEHALPPLLTLDNGRRVSTADEWRNARRAQILRHFEQNVFGRTPVGAVDARIGEIDRVTILDGAAERRQLSLVLSRNGRSVELNLLVYLPSGATAAPAFLGLNFGGNQTIEADSRIRMTTSYAIARTPAGGGIPSEESRGSAASRWPVERIVRRGYGLVTLHCGDIDPDYDDGFQNGVHPLFLEPGSSRPGPTEWGTLGAWAWGLSRALDALASVDGIDDRRVIAIGHSRMGKGALWAAAQDERFAGVVSSCSGCGGAALYRRCFGERIGHITSNFPHWFCAAHTAFTDREADLPVDQHMLLALIAPRMLHVGSATGDLWADPHGEYLGAFHADEAYRLTGAGLGEVDAADDLAADGSPIAVPVRGSTLRYHRTAGGHDITPADWDLYLDHADAYFGA